MEEIRLIMEIHGWGHDQSAIGWEKTGPNPTDGGKLAGSWGTVGGMRVDWAYQSHWRRGQGQGTSSRLPS